MNQVAKLLQQISWTDLTVGTFAGFVAALLLTMLTLHLRRYRSGRSDQPERGGRDDRHQLLLYCGDIKALTDLAVQRHMSNATFLQRFQAQPCYNILSPYFSEDFRERLLQPRRKDGRMDLASACRAECERLERLWQAC